jgi:hypothetical protein
MNGMNLKRRPLDDLPPVLTIFGSTAMLGDQGGIYPMSIHRAKIELKNRDKDYSELLNHWKKAVTKVSENSAEIGLSSYAVLTGTEEHELRFSIFGIKCLMRFRHNFERGVIEYGVIRRDDRSGNELWALVTSVEFDYLGNLGSPYMMHHMGEYDHVHLMILGTHAAEFLKAAYDTGANQ